MRFFIFYINFFSMFFICYFILLWLCNFNNIDLFFKINPDDSLLHYYSYFWLNYTYVYSFFFFFFLFFVITQINSVICNLFWMFYFLYLYEIFNNHIIFNKQCEVLNVLWNDINTLLINNLNKYHPFLFYLNVIILFWILSFFLKFVTVTDVLYQKNITLIYFKKIILWNTQVNLTVLVFGAWWAFQEGTWGGWWNWDPSELFGLFFLIGGLFFMHTKWSGFFFKFYISNFFFFLGFIALFYYFIQLNFDLTSHNFGLRFFFFFNNNFFFFEIFIATLVFCFWIIKTTTLQYNDLILLIKNINFAKNFKNFYINFFLSTLFILYILFTNSIILNYFLWKLFNLNFFLNFNQVNYLNFFIFFLFTFVNLVCCNLIFLIPSLAYPLNFLFIFPFFSRIRFDLIFFIHFFLINFFLISVCTSGLTTFSFLFCNSLFKVDNVIYFNNKTLNLQNIELSNVFILLCNMTYSWGQFCFSNFFLFFSSLNSFFAQTTMHFSAYYYFWKFKDLYVNYLSLFFGIIYVNLQYYIFFKNQPLVLF